MGKAVGMREGLINAGFLGAPVISDRGRERVLPQGRTLRHGDGWDPERFAREQIRSLVRRVFSSNAPALARQVVFSAIEGETDVSTICRRAGEILAMETTGQIAVVGEGPRFNGEEDNQEEEPGSAKPLRQSGTRLRGNLWFVPVCWRERSTASLHALLGKIRSEFDFSIVEGPPAGESNQAAAMAQFADGIILVLLAQRTRRVTAEKIKETLEQAQARLLGAVLCEREFPIPNAIYRRL